MLGDGSRLEVQQRLSCLLEVLEAATEDKEMRLITENLQGNWHDAAHFINELGWAEYLVAISPMHGNYTIAMFKVPEGFPYQGIRDVPQPKPRGFQEPVMPGD